MLQADSHTYRARAGVLRLVLSALIGGLSAAVAAPVAAQMPDPWEATWIVHPEAPADSFGVFHFRRDFQLAAAPERFLVHVSADNRYRLYVNGTEVSSGPARGDLMHWNYETVDLAPHLRPGANTLAAVVWNWGRYRPVAQISYRTAFVLQGEDDAAVVSSGPEWRVHWNRGYSPLPVTGDDVRGYFAAAHGEIVDARAYPWGWEDVQGTVADWQPAMPFAFRAGTEGGALPRGSHPYGEAGGWQLVPRPIPPMEEWPQRLASVRRAEGVPLDERFLRGEGDLVVPANTRAVLLLDQGYNTNAYPVLVTSAGADASVTLTYSEALVDAEGVKGTRNEVEGKTIHGIRDRFILDGGEQRHFRTLAFRTFRYMQLEIQTAEEPLRLHDLHGIFTAFPFEEKGSFSSEEEWLGEMWEINWRTARICAWETYFDTPYYEQLQYVGDTRLQALISLYVAGDDRLMRNSIDQFAHSIIPEGITASRYPSELGQYIPPYSLVWVTMLYDHWLHRGDAEYVRRYLPAARGVLAWYERHLDDSGLLGPMYWWNYVDAPAFDRGVPPGAEDGNSAVITAQFAYTLRLAAALEQGVGDAAFAARADSLADALGTALRAQAWDDDRGLFADTPERDSFSQHVNAFAVLADLLPPMEQAEVMRRLEADSAVVQPNFYFRFYVDEALRHAGLAERYVPRLEPWREMVALGLTTTPEQPDPTRSDSHAWTAHPNYGLLATVLGVRPATAGFETVRIAPAPGPLRRIEGVVPHVGGEIEVKLERSGDAGLRGTIALPPGVTGTFVWQGRELPLRAGVQEVAF